MQNWFRAGLERCCIGEDVCKKCMGEECTIGFAKQCIAII